MFKNIRNKTIHLKYGREVIKNLSIEHLQGIRKPKILDLGVSYGKDLINIRNEIGECDLFGVEFVPEAIDVCTSEGINVAPTDLEQEKLPYNDQVFDMVISNQTYEHLKNIFWCTSEVIRVLKPGGYFILGVPNLASPHCSLPLLFGKQPRQIKVHGPHVRGYTLDGLKDLLLADKYFEFVKFEGSGFYPFPERVAIQMAKWFSVYSTSIFAVFRRTNKEGEFIEEFKKKYNYETSYFNGMS